MSKHRKPPRAKSPSLSSPSEKSPSGKKRNGHDKKELKETIAAEAVVSPKKAEPAPQPVASSAKPAETASAAVGARRRAESTPAPKPAAKAPPRPAAQAVKPVAAPVAKPSAAAQVAPHVFAGAADSFERSFKEARQGTIAVNRKLIDFARENLNSSLDHVRDLAAARSPVRVMRLQMEFWHEWLETFASQTQELRALSAELVERANEPIREHMRSLHRA